MSSDSRLERLGLSHLANDPKALKAELDRQIKEDDKVREKGRREKEALKQKLAASQGEQTADETMTVGDAYEASGASKRSTGIRGLGKKRA